MPPAPRAEYYTWRGGREAMLRWGPTDGPVVVMALPLFEEANRTRAFGVAILRALADLGIGGVLPDLPGQGESERALAGYSVLDLQCAFDEAVAQAGANFTGYGVAIRSGALLDPLGLLAGRWNLAPQTGPELLRDLRRTRQNAGATLPAEYWWFGGSLPEGAPDPPIEIAGNLIGAAMLTDLTVKEPFDEPEIPRRVVRLMSDPRPADAHVDGPALWRRAEPGNDHGFARLLAVDIADWIRACES